MFFVGCLASAVRPATSTSLQPTAAESALASDPKDVALAVCIETAYDNARDLPDVDARLNEWSRWARAVTPGAENQTLDGSLTRHYDTRAVRFALLQCIDTYHRAELDDQMRSYVERSVAAFLEDAPQPL
jgi:hypothetical protein